MDCVAPPSKGGDAIHQCPRADSWLLRGQPTPVESDGGVLNPTMKVLLGSDRACNAVNGGCSRAVVVWYDVGLGWCHDAMRWWWWWWMEGRVEDGEGRKGWGEGKGRRGGLCKYEITLPTHEHAISR